MTAASTMKIGPRSRSSSVSSSPICWFHSGCVIIVADVEGLDEHTAEKVKFFTERYLDAMSPTNFAATNPAVLQKIVETKGGSLVHGLKNMLQDLEDGQGQLKIRMTDTEAFELGKNVAVTPGKVVFQNRMFQLIQYTPTTKKVFKRPLLVVPPWINKFYIMDLQPKNSLLRWLVEQGHTVFVVSWINPDERYSDIGFDTYLEEGVLVATDVVEQITGESEINAIGYCHRRYAVEHHPGLHENQR